MRVELGACDLEAVSLPVRLGELQSSPPPLPESSPPPPPDPELPEPLDPLLPEDPSPEPEPEDPLVELGPLFELDPSLVPLPESVDPGPELDVHESSPECSGSEHLPEPEPDEDPEWDESSFPERESDGDSGAPSVALGCSAERFVGSSTTAAEAPNPEEMTYAAKARATGSIRPASQRSHRRGFVTASR